MSAVFVTATGTEIGKTFVATGLVRHLRRAGTVVDAVKPLLSGFDRTSAADSALGEPPCSRLSRVSRRIA